MTTTHVPAKVTPKDFFLWAGVIITLYTSVFSFLSLMFSIIDVAFPDVLNGGGYDAYSGGMRAAMAALIVMLPLFFILMRVIRSDIAHHAGKADLWVRKWALVFTIFITGLASAIDLITLVNTFLGGEITLRFVLKVFIVLLVAMGFFLHFLADMWGFWDKNPQRARLLAWLVGGIAVATIASCFIIIGTPEQARQYRIDEQKVNDLQNIQMQIVTYYQHKGRLPTTLNDIVDPISFPTIPTDAQSGKAYEYQVGKKDPLLKKQLLRFSLCATFNQVSQNINQPGPVYPIAPGMVSGADNWWHGDGQFCFDRTIDPQLYPQIKDQPTMAPVPIKAVSMGR